MGKDEACGENESPDDISFNKTIKRKRFCNDTKEDRKLLGSFFFVFSRGFKT